MSSPISFETYRVTKQWTVDDFKNRAHHLATNQIYVLSDAEKKSLLKVLSDHSFMPLSVPKFKETLKDLFDFLTEIEKNPQPIEDDFFANAQPIIAPMAVGSESLG